MHDSHHSKRETGIRMRDFATANPLSGNALFTQLSTQLNQALADFDDIAADEEASAGATREGTALREGAREELRDDLEAIARTARAIAQTRPGFAGNFRVPPENNDNELIDAGLGFAERAASEAALFISYGLPTDFIEDLRADTAALQEKIANQSERIADRKGAGVRLDEKAEEIMVIRRNLDALFRNVHRDDAGMLSLWTSAKHLTRRRGAQRIPPATSQTPPPATP